MKQWHYLFKRQSHIEISNGKVIVTNLRDHRHKGRVVEKYLSARFELRKLKRVWLSVEPLSVRAFSHIFLTFDFGKDNFVVSVEARRKQGQIRPVLWGFLPLFTVSYVASTERDMFDLRADARGKDVFMYLLDTTPVESKRLLEVVAQRMNQVHTRAMRFNSVYRNCTSEILRCIEIAVPRFKVGPKKYASTSIDYYLHSKGIFARKAAEPRSSSNVRPRVQSYRKGDFSAWIRQDL